MIPRACWRDEWKRIVYANTTISNACRVLLLALSDSMTSGGEVRRSRTELSKLLGISPRRVTERFNEAVDAGLLERVVAGEPGRLALYAARRPSGAHARTKQRRNDDYLDDRQMVRRTRPSDGADARTKGAGAGEHEHGAHAQPPVVTSATTPTDAPQRSAHEAPYDERAKAASAAEHPSNPDISGFSWTKPATVDRESSTPAIDDDVPSDGNPSLAMGRQHEPAQPDEIRSAHDVLAALGPERYERALREAADADATLAGSALIVAAAQLVRGAA